MSDPFEDVRNKRMGELNSEQTYRAIELWLREKIGPSETFWYPLLQALFRVIDALRAENFALAAAPAPAPLTDERVRDAYMSTNTRTHDQTFAAFRDGVRFAERTTGIGAGAAPAPHPDTADAERYRWLRQMSDTMAVSISINGNGAEISETLDAAIDAARAQAQTGVVGHNLAECNETLRAAGKAYPRTCAECGLGPCRAQAQKG